MIRKLMIAMLGLTLSAANGAAQTARPADIEIRQNIGAELPLDISLRDDAGRQLRLSALFGSRPAILAIVYYRCANLCGIELANLAAALDLAGLSPGRDLDVIAVSMDPRESSADAAARKLALLGRDADRAAGWHFLTGEAAGVAALADAVGLPFDYDPASDQYIHATGVAVVTPGGAISGYLEGLDYPPGNLRTGIAQAASGKDFAAAGVRLPCFSGSAASGLHTVLARALLPGTAAIGLIALGGTLLLARRRGRG